MDFMDDLAEFLVELGHGESDDRLQVTVYRATKNGGPTLDFKCA